MIPLLLCLLLATRDLSDQRDMKTPHTRTLGSFFFFSGNTYKYCTNALLSIGRRRVGKVTYRRYKYRNLQISLLGDVTVSGLGELVDCCVLVCAEQRKKP